MSPPAHRTGVPVDTPGHCHTALVCWWTRRATVTLHWCAGGHAGPLSRRTGVPVDTLGHRHTALVCRWTHWLRVGSQGSQFRFYILLH